VDVKVPSNYAYVPRLIMLVKSGRNIIYFKEMMIYRFLVN